MASPYSTGGGGTHFEARVAATYLAAALCEAPARGLPGWSAHEIRAQRAKDGDPLDDLVVTGTLANGQASKLSLQVKTDIAFSSSNADWQAVVAAAWDTCAAPGFDVGCHRIGVAIANYNANVDKYYQSVLTWAANSASGADFMGRIQTKDFAHAEKRVFVQGIQSIITSHMGRLATDDELWRFLSSFVILHFDLNLDNDRSRDEASAIDRLGLCARPWRGFVMTVVCKVKVGGRASHAR